MIEMPPMFPGGNRIGLEEEQAVLQVLRSKRLFRYYGPLDGPSVVEEFERRFAERMGSQYALAVGSGTAALVASLASLGVGPGDQVIVPSYTWISTPAAVLAVGAVPVLAEVDESLTIDVADAERQITTRTKAIIPVHMRGAAADMSAVSSLAQRYDLKVLEDTAQAAGGCFLGRSLGTLGTMGTYSLQFNKIITCGEGGVIVTDDRHLYERALMYHDVAASLRGDLATDAALIGVTCRLSELQGAVANVQLDRLDDIISSCRANRSALRTIIDDAIITKGLAVRKSNDESGDTSIALVLLAPDATRSRALVTKLRARGVSATVLYDPAKPDYHIAPHWSAILTKRGWSSRTPWDAQDREVLYGPERWDRTTNLLGRTVHFDISPDLTEQQITAIGSAIRDAVNEL